MEQGFLGLIGFAAMGLLLGVAIIAVVRRMRTQKSGLNSATTLLVLALFPAVIGKSVELQTGVARISDLAMNMAIFGAVVALYELFNRTNLTSDPAENYDGGKRRAVLPGANLSASNQTLLGTSLLAAVIVSAVVLTTFIGWDLRRLSASASLAANHDHPDLTTRANAWTDAQAQAPERESITYNLFESHLKVAREQYALGNEEEALRLLGIGRSMLLDYEKRDPFELDTQIGLSKAVAQYATWGHIEYTQELADRSIKIVETYPAYPTLIGTAATAMTSVGAHELAIEYADLAIATEATTRPWPKAWYAKGRALYELGRKAEAIEALNTATQKEQGAEGALLAHQVLAQIYKADGDMEKYEIHTILGQGDITVQE